MRLRRSSITGAPSCHGPSPRPAAPRPARQQAAYSGRGAESRRARIGRGRRRARTTRGRAAPPSRRCAATGRPISNTEWVTKTTVTRSALPELEQIGVQAVARDLVEGGERLVHQQQPRLRSPGRGRSTRASSCRPTARAARRARSPPARHAPSASAAAPRARPSPCRCSFSGNATLASAVAHGIRVGSWKTKPRSALPVSADQSIVPALGSARPAIRRSNVDLPQPDGPEHAQEFAGLDIERDIGESLDAVRKDLRDTANADKLHQADGNVRSSVAVHTGIGRRVARGEVGRQLARGRSTCLNGSTRPPRTPNTASLVEILVVLGEELGDQRLVARRLDDHVQMRRPPGVAAERAQHVAGRAVVGHRVGDRPHGREGEGAVVGHRQPRVIVGRDCLGILLGIEAVAAVLPQRQHRALGRRALVRRRSGRSRPAARRPGPSTGRRRWAARARPRCGTAPAPTTACRWSRR